MRIQVLIDIDGVTLTPDELQNRMQYLTKRNEFLHGRMMELMRDNHELYSELNAVKRKLAKAEEAADRWYAAQDVLPDEEWQEESDDRFPPDPNCAVVLRDPLNDEWDAWQAEGAKRSLAAFKP